MKRLFMAIALLASTVMLTGCFGIIDQGNVGVRSAFGDVDQKPVTGMYQSFFSTVTEYTTKETNVAINDLTPRAKDNLTLDKMGVTLYYTTNAAKLPNFQATTSGQSARLDGDDALRPGYVMLATLSRGVIADVVSRFDSLTLNTNRQALEQEIKALSQKNLDSAAPGTFHVTRVVITRVETDKSIEQSIRDNVTASKRLDTATKQVMIKEQEALANKAIAEQLTPAFLQHEYNQAVNTCAANTNCTLIIDGSGSGKILNVNK